MPKPESYASTLCLNPSQVTGAVNMISVTMVPNVNIVSPAVITITGCVSETDDSETLALGGDGAALFTGQVASWSREARSLELQARLLNSQYIPKP